MYVYGGPSPTLGLGFGPISGSGQQTALFVLFVNHSHQILGSFDLKISVCSLVSRSLLSHALEDFRFFLVNFYDFKHSVTRRCGFRLVQISWHHFCRDLK